MQKATSITGYLGMMAGLLGLLYTKQLFSSAPWVMGLQSAAVVLMVWARIAFGRRSFHLAANPTAGGLVMTGPYGVIRHPIYAAVCLFTLAGAAANWSYSSAIFCALILGGALVRIFCEETLLRRRYPAYIGYAAKTWRMVPCVF